MSHAIGETLEVVFTEGKVSLLKTKKLKTTRGNETELKGGETTTMKRGKKGQNGTWIA